MTFTVFDDARGRGVGARGRGAGRGRRRRSGRESGARPDRGGVQTRRRASRARA